ncbi:MAG: hypothetical protein GF329_06045 [Candidatus Lokiarchaeota archaeon]|nr:hypothetical protein [Candidatus Lokiarchaeota archaeon]
MVNQFELQKVFLLRDVSSEEMRKYIECIEFWHKMITYGSMNVKKLEIEELDGGEDHLITHDTVAEVEIDSLGFIKRTLHIKQRIRIIEEGERMEDNIKINGVNIIIEESNHVRDLDCHIKIEEKPGKARVTFGLNRMVLHNEILDLLGDRIATNRFKREVKHVFKNIQNFIDSGKIKEFNETC